MWIWFVVWVVGMVLTFYLIGMMDYDQVLEGTDTLTIAVAVVIWPLLYLIIFGMMLIDIDEGEENEN
jgi:hypothetical protein